MGSGSWVGGGSTHVFWHQTPKNNDNNNFALPTHGSSPLNSSDTSHLRIFASFMVRKVEDGLVEAAVMREGNNVPRGATELRIP